MSDGVAVNPIPQGEDVLVDDVWVPVSLPDPQGAGLSKGDVIRMASGPVTFDGATVVDVEYEYSVTRVTARVDGDVKVVISASSGMSDIDMERLESNSVDWTRMSSSDIVRFDLIPAGALSASTVFRHRSDTGYLWFDDRRPYVSVDDLSAAFCQVPLVSARMVAVG